MNKIPVLFFQCIHMPWNLLDLQVWWSREGDIIWRGTFKKKTFKKTEWNPNSCRYWLWEDFLFFFFSESVCIKLDCQSLCRELIWYTFILLLHFYRYWDHCRNLMVFGYLKYTFFRNFLYRPIYVLCIP